MNTSKMVNEIADTIINYRENNIIMEFVTTEALNKVASEMRALQPGTVTTGKAVEVLAMRYENIKSRVDDYVASGLLGCYMASLEA